MMTDLPVVVHSDTLIGAPAPHLPSGELDHICVLLSMGPASADFLNLQQCTFCFPESQELRHVGVYEAVWQFEGDSWFIYLTNSGFIPIEIRRYSKGRSLIADADGKSWLDRATAKLRRLHEALATSESGV